ncbi:MAG: (2Fe-2S)-binding protein [Chloroflexota bacterium]|nr:(2Fe-2S)-binding protein [Chloroflexota bacterium]
MTESVETANDGEWRALDRSAGRSQAVTPLVPFSWNGRELVGHAGEPLAVALLAHKVRVFRVMPGGGETRGGFCMVGRCADCLVSIDGVANVRACVTPLRAGMIATLGYPQNGGKSTE